jgi:hypothetical protein
MTGSVLPDCITEIISLERFEELKIVTTDQFESVINGFFEMIKKESMKMTTLPLLVLTYLSREGFKKQHVFFESSLELIQWFEVKKILSTFWPQSKHEFIYSNMKNLYYAYVGISSLILNICYTKHYYSGRPPISPTPVTPLLCVSQSADITIWVDDVYLKPLPPFVPVCPRFAESGLTPRQDDRNTSPSNSTHPRSTQSPRR